MILCFTGGNRSFLSSETEFTMVQFNYADPRKVKEGRLLRLAKSSGGLYFKTRPRNQRYDRENDRESDIYFERDIDPDLS